MKTFFRNHKQLLIPGILLLFGFVAGTIAWLTARANLTNAFEPGEVSVTVTEAFDDYIKSNVAVENTGTVPTYIRATIVASFIDDTNGRITGEEPVMGRDYTITFSNSTNWVRGSDGYYYYTQPVSPNASTDVLIDRAEQLIEYSGRSLHIQIASQGIQATPTTAVTDSWDVTVNANGTINPPQE